MEVDRVEGGLHGTGNVSGGVLPPSGGHPVAQHGYACGPTQHREFTPNLFWAHHFSLVCGCVERMCHPRQLFFSPCRPETPKGGTALERLPVLCGCHAVPRAGGHQKMRPAGVARLLKKKECSAFVKAVCLSYKYFAVRKLFAGAVCE